MAYSPATDFLGLLRQTSGGVRSERMPGLDYVVMALARAGLFALSVGQAAPTANQASTVWLQPSSPSWVAEGTVWLWNAAAAAYQVATPALWNALLAPGGYSFQSVAGASGVILPGTSVLAVQRAAPAATALVLPNLAAQWLTGRAIKLVDWSTAVTLHDITVTTPDGSTIMQQASWQFMSNAAQLASATLYPSPDLNGWIIA